MFAGRRTTYLDTSRFEEALVPFVGRRFYALRAARRACRRLERCELCFHAVTDRGLAVIAGDAYLTVYDVGVRLGCMFRDKIVYERLPVLLRYIPFGSPAGVREIRWRGIRSDLNYDSDDGPGSQPTRGP